MKRINVEHEAELIAAVSDLVSNTNFFLEDFSICLDEEFAPTLTKELRKIYDLGYNHGKKDLAVLVCANQPIFAKYSLSPEDLKDLKSGSLIRVEKV